MLRKAEVADKVRDTGGGPGCSIIWAPPMSQCAATRTALAFSHTWRSLWAFGPSVHRTHASLWCHRAGTSLCALPRVGAARQSFMPQHFLSAAGVKRTQETGLFPQNMDF